MGFKYSVTVSILSSAGMSCIIPTPSTEPSSLPTATTSWLCARSNLMALLAYREVSVEAPSTSVFIISILHNKPKPIYNYLKTINGHIAGWAGCKPNCRIPNSRPLPSPKRGNQSQIQNRLTNKCIQSSGKPSLILYSKHNCIKNHNHHNKSACPAFCICFIEKRCVHRQAPEGDNGNFRVAKIGSEPHF